jgi:1-acyl-sn-glycerol-3-phosphate acyltransferase
MNDRGYHLLMDTLDLFLWDGEVLGLQNLPRQGPAVLIANHLDAAGPIGVLCSLPVRLYPWIIADMMDHELAPDYLRKDFIERQLHFKPPLSRWIAQGLCKITNTLFDSVGCIPVYRNDYVRLQTTYKLSQDYLRQGKILLVFPEDNSVPMDPVTKLQPFMHGFVRLAETYYAETHECLDFYPVTVHGSRYIEIGKPTAFDPLNHTGSERQRIKRIMEETIRDTYLKLERGDTSLQAQNAYSEGARETKWEKSPHDI